MCCQQQDCCCCEQVAACEAVWDLDAVKCFRRTTVADFFVVEVDSDVVAGSEVVR